MAFRVVGNIDPSPLFYSLYYLMTVWQNLHQNLVKGFTLWHRQSKHIITFYYQWFLTQDSPIAVLMFMSPK